MTISRPLTRAALRLVACVTIVAQSGCMSALTTASLRDVLLDTVDSLAEATAHDADVAARMVTDEGVTDDAIISEPAKPLSLDEAVDRAVSHLKGVGDLDPATQATLLSILENTNPQDWPAAIDAFTASLEVHRPPRPAAVPAPAPVAAVEPQPTETLAFPTTGMTSLTATVQPADPPAFSDPLELPANEASLAFPVSPEAEPVKAAFVEAARPVVPQPLALVGRAAPAAETVAEPALTVAPVVVLEPLAAEEPLAIDDLLVVDTEPSEPAPPLLESPPPSAPIFAVRNACFVTRVRAWGVVDRFPEATFRPGQDVIAYFELDAPTARESPGGHTTSIDTIFRLIAADGRQIGQWDFEPIDETCHAPRRDYFARYFLRIPETAPAGPCRLEFMVTDLITGTSTQAHLDLEVR